MDPNTPLDSLPDDFGADHEPRPGCCADCDDALDFDAWTAELSERAA